MRGLKKQRRIQVIALALVCLTGATALIGFALRDGINLFRSPTQVAELAPLPGEIFRLGGLVADDSISAGEGVQFFFDITWLDPYVAGCSNGIPLRSMHVLA